MVEDEDEKVKEGRKNNSQNDRRKNIAQLC